MTTRAYRISGFALLFTALAVAVALQVFGGGLLKVVDAHETGPAANGSAGGFVVSMVLQVKWSALIPLALTAAAIACLIVRGHEQPVR